MARFVTSAGNIEAELYEKQTPSTVRNFVALARGDVEWTKPDSMKTRAPLYTNSVFSPRDSGLHDPGRLPARRRPRRPGLAVQGRVRPRVAGTTAPASCRWRNSGPGTNGSQFFITEGPRRTSTRQTHRVRQGHEGPRPRREDRPDVEQQGPAEQVEIFRADRLRSPGRSGRARARPARRPAGRPGCSMSHALRRSARRSRWSAGRCCPAPRPIRRHVGVGCSLRGGRRTLDRRAGDGAAGREQLAFGGLLVHQAVGRRADRACSDRSAPPSHSASRGARCPARRCALLATRTGRRACRGPGRHRPSSRPNGARSRRRRVRSGSRRRSDRAALQAVVAGLLMHVLVHGLGHVRAGSASSPPTRSARRRARASRDGPGIAWLHRPALVAGLVLLARLGRVSP
jgi:cyclophilin family peptidyl-prolyl cis-trans isomerase